MLVGQSEQMSTAVASSVHASGAIGACGEDAASAWRFQSLTRCSAQITGPSLRPYHLCILLDLGTSSGGCGNTTEPCLCSGCLLEK